MALRVCSVPNCPELTRRGKCVPHRREADRERGTTTEKGRGWKHQQERRRWAARIARAPVPCARCGRPIHHGDDWHLDHDESRTGYLGPSHALCNLSAGGRAAHQ